MKQFDYVEAKRPKRSAFDLSHERKTTLNMGELVPVMCTEILPGDTFKLNFETFLRTLPLVSPVMHRVNVFAHAFFVPMRLLWEENKWEQFITGKGPASVIPSIDPNFFDSAGYLPTRGDLFDHLGYGLMLDGNAKCCQMSQMPIRAYHKIWNDHYRDQNFQNEYDILGLPDLWVAGTDITTFATTRRRAWEKDYFTAALPTQQRGNVVSLPLGDTAPVQSKFHRTGVATDTIDVTTQSGAITPTTPLSVEIGAHAAPTELQAVTSGGKEPIANITGLEADLSAATGSSVTALRRAFALQRWYEASMRFGQRYVEQLLGLFGVVSKDARLQRAEFIAGGKLPIQIGEVLQTSGSNITGQTSPQGNMAGRAVSIGNMLNFSRSFTEHGYLMIIISVLPRTSYDSLALRQNFKLDKFDFAFPQLSHLSEQPVYEAEIYNVCSSDALGKTPFGYQPVYSEYRYIPDSVHGEFRQSLAYWSLARHVDLTAGYGAGPGLNEAFITCTPPTDIWPVEGAEHQLLLQTFAKITAIRPLPKFGTPV